MTTTGEPGPVTGAPARAQLCERLLADLRGEIARADSKASVLVAALGLAAGVFSGMLAGRNWSPTSLSGPGTVAWWTGIAALALSLFALLLAVLPRYRRDAWAPGRPLSYFGDIQQAVRANRLEAALDDTERDPTAGLVAALTETSGIAARKHQWIRTGLIAFCVGTVLVPASLLIG
ncbi:MULTISPECIES: Pycsar system effector family protein [unclassified Streptomyces]|uniref:Pycsar system effector family protein n=1 Tax=unclassified Streptomyces TaxID=2593676 RepID=UPI001F03978E|nr:MULTISPECIES: Pycsar system effector family protein [unclassified Streptomyces]